MKKATLQLEPLTCPSCVKKIESVLNRTEGVGSATVLFNASKVKVEFDEGRIGAEQLAKVVEDLGYAVLSTKIS